MNIAYLLQLESTFEGCGVRHVASNEKEAPPVGIPPGNLCDGLLALQNLLYLGWQLP